MQKYPEIKQFVQETLGCSCPEEVFNKIEYEKEPCEPWERRVNVGGRLLIYIINIGLESDLPGKLISALKLGVAERNSQGFNRFRLVLVSSRPSELRVMAEQAFHNSAYYDERTNIHIVSQNDIASFDKNA